MAYPSRVESWLSDQAKERENKEIDGNHRGARLDLETQPNSNNRRGRRRLNELAADTSKGKGGAAPQIPTLRRSARIAGVAAHNVSLGDAAQPINTPSKKRQNEQSLDPNKQAPDTPTTIPTITPATARSGFSYGLSSSPTNASKRSKKISDQRYEMGLDVDHPSRAAICFNAVPEHLNTSGIPKDIRVFRNRFSDAVLSNCIPEELKPILNEKYPDETFPDYYFSPDFGSGLEMLKMAEGFSKESLDLRANSRDEGEWGHLTRDILKTFGVEGNPNFMAADVTTQILAKELYPNLNSSKIDHVIMLNRNEFFNKMSRFPKHIPLSAFSNHPMKQTIIPLGVEVKSSSGQSIAEAETQLGVWAAKTGRVYLDWVEFAEKNKGRKHNQDTYTTKIKPVIGVTVLGSSWSYHVLYHVPHWEYTNTYVVLGEYHLANTNTIYGIFRIAKFLKIIHDWVMEELWPWCVELLEPKEQGKKDKFVRPVGPARQTRSRKPGPSTQTR